MRHPVALALLFAMAGGYPPVAEAEVKPPPDPEPPRPPAPPPLRFEDLPPEEQARLRAISEAARLQREEHTQKEAERVHAAWLARRTSGELERLQRAREKRERKAALRLARAGGGAS